MNGAEALPVSPDELFYGENGFDTNHLPWRPARTRVQDGGETFGTAEDAWRGLLRRSIVPAGWRNSGLHTVCYLRASDQWSLSNWIWTSGAIARYYASVDDVEGVVRIADAFLAHQLESGGWVVRFDYLSGGTTPIEAPNDSAYMASNALLYAFEKTSDPKYLDAARRCAEWIMQTALPDGMVPFGYNQSSKRWVTEVNIVDVGFTAELFVHLYRLTHELQFLSFAERFVDAYVSRFRNEDDGSFATSINGTGQRFGGKFARGQAWALEGIIPLALQSVNPRLEEIVERLAGVLVEQQQTDGSWTYNLSHRYSGADCKGIPVIAKSLAVWGSARDDGRVLEAAARAVAWSRNHTALDGPGAGGIFSYSLEGAVTHSFYSEAAFVYASAYALEAAAILDAYDVGS